ncbi:hypothetical protein J7400_18820 [Shimia sp. R9_2]|uniref:hypothetical protein n=1 Tax=Shimia sp. R9_2 TaxID=2821112 RepID=UPI001ADC37DA|nr:hypothetical protein [Shimia sp. R9_2]MBO9398731.1 hypothetical protein [Shimia sp. R9_2]
MTRSVEDALVVRMEASLRKFERQMEQGRKAAVNSARGSEAAWNKAGNQIAANSNRAATGLQRLTAVSKQQRFVIQNTTNQISDMAVQWEMGTDAMRIAGQQLPQTIAGFAVLGGTIGAVAPVISALIAIGAPAAAMFLNIGENAEEAGEETEKFGDKVRSAISALSDVEKALSNLAEGGLEHLIEKYSDASKAVRDLQSDLLELEVRAAKIEVGEVIDDALGDDFKASLEKIFGGVGGAVAESTRKEFAALENEILAVQSSIEQREGVGLIVDPSEHRLLKEMREELALLNGDLSAAGDLASEIEIDPSLLVDIDAARKRLKGAVDEADFSGVADGLNTVRMLLQQIGDDIDQGVIDEMIKAEDVVRQAAARFDQAGEAVKLIKDEAGGIGVSFDGAIQAAQSLNQELWDAVSAASKLSGNSVSGGRGGDPRSFENDPYWKERYFPDPEKPQKKTRTKSPRSSRDTSGLREAERLYESTRTEAERYATELERINDLHRRFPEIITSDVRDRAIGALKESATEVGKIAQMMGRSFEDAFTSLVTSTGKGSDALRAFVADLTRMAVRGAAANFDISGLITGLAGGGTGGSASGGLLGGAIIPGILHSGGVAGRDGYGHGRAFSPSTWSGAPRYHEGGIAGLKPGEVPAILKKGELVVPEGGSMPVMQPSASGDLVVNIHNAPEGDHRVSRSSDGRELNIVLEDAAIKAVTGPKGQRAMGQTYGLRTRGLGG